MLFSDKAVIVDSRDGTPKLVPTGTYPDTVFFLVTLPEALTEKQILYDLVCILGDCIESARFVSGALSLPMVLHAMKGTVSALRAIPSGETVLDRGHVQTAGIQSAWAFPHTGIGFALGTCAESMTGVSFEWITAALIPEISRYCLRQDNARIEVLLDVLDLESTGNGEEDIAAVEEEVRSMAGLADVPLRLRDLGVDPDQTSNIADCASGICGIRGDTLLDILRAAE
jgi:alcohol dehydrogenase class IV